MDKVDCLHLDIDKCSCDCGNTWTHSTPWLASEGEYLGGTPTPEQARTLKVKSMVESNLHYHQCFRCVPLGLGKSWIADKNRILEELRAAKRAALAAKTEDLLA